MMFVIRPLTSDIRLAAAGASLPDPRQKTDVSAQMSEQRLASDAV